MATEFGLGSGYIYLILSTVSLVWYLILAITLFPGILKMKDIKIVKPIFYVTVILFVAAILLYTNHIILYSTQISNTLSDTSISKMEHISLIFFSIRHICFYTFVFLQLYFSFKG
eukprot:445027_1